MCHFFVLSILRCYASLDKLCKSLGFFIIIKISPPIWKFFHKGMEKIHSCALHCSNCST